jgi:hypothetical protein
MNEERENGIPSGAKARYLVYLKGSAEAKRFQNGLMKWLLSTHLLLV